MGPSASVVMVRSVDDWEPSFSYHATVSSPRARPRRRRIAVAVHVGREDGEGVVRESDDDVPLDWDPSFSSYHATSGDRVVVLGPQEHVREHVQRRLPHDVATHVHTGSSVGRNNAPRTTPVAAKSTLTSCGKALAADTTGGYRSAPPARTGPGTGLYRSDDRRRPGAPVPHEIVPVHATGPRYMHFGIYGGSPRAAARSIRRIGGRGCRAPMAAPSSSTIGPRAQPSDSIRVPPCMPFEGLVSLRVVGSSPPR